MSKSIGSDNARGSKRSGSELRWGESSAGFDRIDLGEGDFEFLPDESPDGGQSSRPIVPLYWEILVADDEFDAREAARMALEGLELLGRPLRLHFAESAEQAELLLAGEPRMAVALLDVVMETPTAGLDLVKSIRAQKCWAALRIILRTGQPGYAPELEVAKNYDINDYKAKSELTQSKLVASLASALRAHSQIEALQWQGQKLDRLAQSTGLLVESGADPLEVAKQAAVLCAEILEDSQIAMSLKMEGKDWVVAATGFGVPGEVDDFMDPCELHDFARRGAQQAQCAAALKSAMAMGVESRTQIRDADGARAKVLKSGEHAVALWWAPGSKRSTESLEPLFEACCACIAAAMESAMQRSKARKAAFWDDLTNLPNRAWLMQSIDSCPAAQRDGKEVMFVDLVGFSAVNDALGYDAGDAMLKEAAEALGGAMPDCMLARMPGGAFAVMGPSESVDDEKARQAFETPLSAAGWELPVKIQMGKASLGSRKDARQSLNEANMALNALKSLGAEAGVCRSHDDELAREARERHKIAKDLKRALRGAGGLSLYYQPQIDSVSGLAVGVEALARWRMPDGSMIPPARFVAVAEACGLVGELGDWALEEACRQAKAWRISGVDLTMAVNVSPLQIESAGLFLDKLAACLDKSECEPSWIELEITEAAAMKDAGQAKAAIEEARKWGCKAALDDFGTGFSSLGRLASWPLDKLKMDRSLVAPLEDDIKSRSIARMVVGLGNELGLKVVAEGVETKQQSDLLKAMGVSLEQGWLHCAALPDHELLDRCAKGFK